MLCAWEVAGRQSLVEAWCMRIGKAESPASGVKESVLNAWHAIFLWLLKLNWSQRYTKVWCGPLNDLFTCLLLLYLVLSPIATLLALCLFRSCPVEICFLAFLSRVLLCVVALCLSSRLLWPCLVLSCLFVVASCLFSPLVLCSSPFVSGSVKHTSLLVTWDYTGRRLWYLFFLKEKWMSALQPKLFTVFGTTLPSAKTLEDELLKLDFRLKLPPLVYLFKGVS